MLLAEGHVTRRLFAAMLGSAGFDEPLIMVKTILCCLPSGSV